MDDHDNPFLVEPPSDLDSKVFAKIAPVLKENKQIQSRKQWLQIWLPLASTTALTVFGFLFLNSKIETGSPAVDGDADVAENISPEMDFQSFASLDLDEDGLELANNFEIIEDLDLLESYSEDDENS